MVAESTAASGDLKSLFGENLELRLGYKNQEEDGEVEITAAKGFLTEVGQKAIQGEMNSLKTWFEVDSLPTAHILVAKPKACHFGDFGLTQPNVRARYKVYPWPPTLKVLLQLLRKMDPKLKGLNYCVVYSFAASAGQELERVIGREVDPSSPVVLISVGETRRMRLINRKGQGLKEWPVGGGEILFTWKETQKLVTFSIPQGQAEMLILSFREGIRSTL